MSTRPKSPYPPAIEGQAAAWHAPEWHASCSDVTVVLGPAGLVLWCPSCRCAVPLEAVSARADIKGSAVPASPPSSVGVQP